MANVTIANPTNNLNLALKIFSGEVLTAYPRLSLTEGLFTERTITSGKSAQFPVIGRTKAHYLKPGMNLDEVRENIGHAEKTIVIDGLLTADALIADIDDFINHYDVRQVYAHQIAEALAISKDASAIAEVAKEVVANKENLTGLGKGAIVERTLKADEKVGINPATGKQIYDILLEVSAKMSNNHVPEGDRSCFVTPEHFSALASVLDFLNKNYGANGTITEGKVMRLAGFDIKKCPHLTRGGDDKTNVLQGEGHEFPSTYKDKSPIIMCHKSSIGILKLKDLRTEHARRPEFQADQIIASYAIGMGGLRPEACFMGIVKNNA